MSKNFAVTEAARQAGKKMAIWDAVETYAKRTHEAMALSLVTGDFAELCFSDEGVRGVVKAGNVILQIDCNKK